MDRKEITPGLGYEKIVAGIYRQFAGTAEVIENEKVRGRSGRLRQIDVALHTTIVGNPLLVVIECKDYGRRVGIERVDGLIGKINDGGAPASGGIYSMPCSVLIARMRAMSGGPGWANSSAQRAKN